MPAATVRLTNEDTGVAVTKTTNSEGYFSFPDLQIGSYAITVEMAGFKKYNQGGIKLTAGQIRNIGDLNMTLGEVAETITVESSTVAVSLSSGEKSGVITGEELENTALRGRDYLDMLRLLPGVVDESDGREAPGPDGIRSLYINGARDNQKNVTIDGITSMDTGSNGTTHTAPTLGTIAEVKILTSAYQAEFGRAVGGTIIVTTRGGSQRYRGTAFWTHRHEEFNANDYFANQTGLQKNPYRYNLFGYNIGGPLWPKNRKNSRVFFFFSQEFSRQKVNYNLQRVRMPTALERKGDFSQTLDVNQNRLSVYDPLTAQPFPGNIVPANRINKNGQAILNMLPLPNFTDPVATRAVQWNYVTQPSGAYPKRQDMIRLDWAPDQKWQVNFRYTNDADEQHPIYVGCGACWITGSMNFDLTPLTFRQPGRGLVISATRPIGPTWTSETRLGWSMNRLTSFPDEPEKITKKNLGIDLVQWHPEQNPYGFIPNVTFGTPGTAPNMTMNNSLPYKNVNNIFSVAQNFSKITGTHTTKMGVYVERSRKDQLQGTPTRGTISFSDDGNNPLRTRYGYASALMGIMTSYQEATSKPYGFYRFTNFEFFLQDNWKVSRRFTLDYGLRFYHDLPQAEVRGQVAAFVQSAFDTKNSAVLITDTRSAAGARVGYDPISRKEYNIGLFGTLAPGHGSPSNGMVVAGTNGFPLSMYSIPNIMFGPRIGFAYALTRDARTALRGGFGIFFDRVQGNPTMNMVANPPSSFSPTLYYSTFDDLAATAGAAVLAPSTINHSLYGHGTMPQSYQYTMSIQRQIRRSTMIDLAYVGKFERHLLWQKNINPIPIGAQLPNLHPENRDPYNNNALYSANFLRPYQGYGDILEYEFGGTSSYNALQAQFSTRMRAGLQLRGSYTFSKALGSAATDTSQVNPFFSPRDWNYGRLSYSRDHVLTLLPNWSMPRSALPQNRVLRTAMAGWSIYATGQFTTGQPYRPSFSTVDGENFAGTSSISGAVNGAVLTYVGNLGCGGASDCPLAQQFIRPGMPRPSGQIETPVFGNLGVNTYNRPGINNWDARLQRRFNVTGDGKKTLDFRFEAFNVFNHTQFSNIDTTARFDANGRQINALFLTETASRRPRFLSMGLQLNF